MLLDNIELREIKPALSGYLKDTRSLVTLHGIPDEKAVHDARVFMKRARAAVRLVRSQTDEKTFLKEYNACRDVGRLLCSWRETSVLRRFLKDLKKKNPDLFSRLADNERISLLLKKPAVSEVPSAETVGKLAAIDDILKKAYYRIRFVSMQNYDKHLLLAELENTYQLVGDCYLVARNAPSTANLHEFRKKAKDLLYQLSFFRPLKPQAVKNLEKRLEKITGNLGKFNDLSVLINELGYKYSRKAGNNADLDELVVIIRNEQDRYLMKMWPSAFRIFCPGKKFIELLGFS